MDELLREFLTESADHLDTVDAELVRFERNPNDAAVLRHIFRLVHTIKGTCGFLGLPRLEALSHAAETLMGRFRDGVPVTEVAVTLVLTTLDRLKGILAALEATGAEPAGSDEDLVGALERMAEGAAAAPPLPSKPQPITAAQELRPGGAGLAALEATFLATPGPDMATRDLAAITAAPIPATPARSDGNATATQTIRVNVETVEHLMTMVSELVLTRNQLMEIARTLGDDAYKVPLQRLSQVAAELQEGVMKTRMQPIGSAWQKLPRVVRDLSSELGKKIDLLMQGAETELDRQVLEVIKDPLTHMVRNSADHGIESGSERKAAGKPEKGTIRLNAFHEGGTITIEIADDGKGLDLATIRRKAVERGIATEAEVERMSDAQVAKFIFHAGFSTAKAITSVSGRGVGMDVVKTNIELIGGTVDIRTQFGQGTTFTIKIPLTLAIVAALIVSARDHRFAIPQVSVLELVRVQPGSDHQVERINGSPVLRLRDRLLPIVPIAGMLGLDKDPSTASTDEGFVVVSQVGRQRFGILVDSVFHTEEIVVKPMSSKLRHIPLFSGNTILGNGAVVLIVDPNGVARQIGRGEQQCDRREEVAAPKDEPETATFLVFRGGDILKAVPLSLVTRLEEVDATAVERLGERALLQYRGRLMPLVPVDGAVQVRTGGTQPLVVFSDGERAMGLLVEDIVDIVEESPRMEQAPGRPDLVGIAVLRGQATEIVDAAHFLPLAYPDSSQSAARREVTAGSVLLVDDVALSREMMASALRTAGYRIVAAADIGQAMAALAGEASTGAVVANLDFVAALRSDRRLAGLPVVGLAAAADPGTLAKARALDVTDLVSRFDPPGLLAAMAELRPASRALAA